MSQRLREYEIVGLGEPDHESSTSPFLDEELFTDSAPYGEDEAFENAPASDWEALELVEHHAPSTPREEWAELEDEEFNEAADWEEAEGSWAETELRDAEEGWPEDEAWGSPGAIWDEGEALPSDGYMPGVDVRVEELAAGEEFEDLVFDELLFEDEAYFETQVSGGSVTFPSGESLSVTSGPEATEADEYFDPHHRTLGKSCRLSANPLLDTSGPHRSKRVSTNFTVHELTKSGGMSFEKARIDPELVKCLQAIRDHVGRGVTVNSGYRSWGYNRRLYQKRGKKPTRSQHCSGRAADIRISGMSGLEIAKAALDAYGCDLALGVGRNYAHIDLRGCFAVWSYGDVGSKSRRDAVESELRSYRGRRCTGSRPSPGTPPPAAPASTTPTLSRALVRNRYWAQRLGWDRHRVQIGTLLGFTNMSPTEQLFAEAVERWQRERGLSADGIIGPKTWERMRALISGGSSGPPTGAAGGAGAGTAPSPSSAPALGGARIPSGFKLVKRKGRPRGLSRYGGGRLDSALAGLRRRRGLQITDREIDVFQRIANIETAGNLQGINTWDSAVISIGFMQFTMQHGKVQEWIQRAPSAFGAYGIELDSGRSYTWRGKGQTAIRGATRDELRWNGWAERFYQVGLNGDAVIAEVGLARDYLARHLAGLKRRIRKKGVDANGFALFKRHYDASANVRGMMQASFNNHPDGSASGVARAIRAAGSDVSTGKFELLLKSGIRRAFADRNLAHRGEHLTTKTLSGARI